MMQRFMFQQAVWMFIHLQSIGGNFIFRLYLMNLQHWNIALLIGMLFIATI